MALIETLKGTLMALGVIALLIFVIIAGEIAVMLLVQIIDDFRERIRTKRWKHK